MHPAILDKKPEIVAACQKYGVARLDIFGSAARGRDFDPLSGDADFLVDFPPASGQDHFLDLKEAFEKILGRPIDLVDRKAVESSRNYLRRRHILAEAEPVCVA
ncbi:nucleotidyltransferase domain-containing protein [uncultured Rhodoblastus sp.]|uniref:nucleotidyltransferase family protein n=1 Tax=uncultured Rhodoblastus sp. TaxID=543037 RepID=UPI0025E444BC|nr:nucleotidyltransferase domain-containing protein [uncultured Rhodoblastus sp.]